MTIDHNADTIEVLGYTLRREGPGLDPFDEPRGEYWHAETDGLSIELVRLAYHGDPLWQLVISREASATAIGHGASPQSAAQDLLIQIAKLSKWADEARKRGAQ